MMKYLWICGIIIHLTLFFAVHDMLYNNISLEKREYISKCTVQSPPAQRVLLVIVEGLGLDTFSTYLNKTTNSFLANVVKQRGTFGASLGRVPVTVESSLRAMLGGVHDSPVSMFPWVENPEVNTVQDLVREVFQVDYKNHETKFLDSHEFHAKWVFFEVPSVDLFNDHPPKIDDILLNHLVQRLKLISDKKVTVDHPILFIVRLLGGSMNFFLEDTDGATRSLDRVDIRMRQLESAFQKVFKDNQTVFLLTGDHGVSSRGSYGQGSDQELWTPIVAWGAGIAHQNGRDTLAINQTDVSPLIASLLGLPVPVSSLGACPRDFLTFNYSFLSEALACNALQLLSLHATLQSSVNSSSTSWYPVRFFHQRAKRLIRSNDFYTLVNISQTEIYRSQNNLLNFKTFYMPWILLKILTLQLVWGIFLFVQIFENFEMAPVINYLRFMISCITSYEELRKQQLPYFNVIVKHIPEILIKFVLRKSVRQFLRKMMYVLKILTEGGLMLWILQSTYYQIIKGWPLKHILYQVVMSGVIFLCLESKVWLSFEVPGVKSMIGFLILAVTLGWSMLFLIACLYSKIPCMAGIASLSWLTSLSKRNKPDLEKIKTLWYWSLGLLAVSICLGKPPPWIRVHCHVVGIAVWSGLGIWLCTNNWVMYLILPLFWFSSIFTILEAYDDVNIFSEYKDIAWVTFPVALVLSIFHNIDLLPRMLQTTFAILIPFTLLSFGADLCSFLNLSCNVLVWFIVDSSTQILSSHSEPSQQFREMFRRKLICMSDIRNVVIAMLFSIISLYVPCSELGISSWDIKWVRSFVNSISEHTDYSVLLVLSKYFMQIIVVLMILHVLMIFTRASINGSYIIILFILNGMSLHNILTMGLDNWESLSIFYSLQAMSCCIFFAYPLAKFIVTTPPLSSYIMNFIRTPPSSPRKYNEQF